MNRYLYKSIFFFLSLANYFPASAQCSIFDLTAEVVDCANGQFYVILNFEYTGVSGEGFRVQGNGVNYGNFNYNQLPITLGPLTANSTNYEFVVKDLVTTTCTDFVVVGQVNCGGACDIFDMSAVPGDCNPDGTYPLTINFFYVTPTDDHFDVIYQGQNIGFFALADLPVTIPHFQDNGNTNQAIKVCINDNAACCAEKAFTAPNCSAGDCHIFDMTAVAGPCENGMFYVTIDFQHENTGDDGFKVQGNGNIYGQFSYDDLPVVLGPFAGNGTANYEFVVKDISHPACSAFSNLGTVSCALTASCDIFDLVIEPGDCNDDGTYPIFIEFGISNSITNYYKIFYDGELIGTRHIAMQPGIIEHFQDNGEAHPLLQICMTDQPDCCASVEFTAPDCPEPADCHITNVVAEAHNCENGQFYVDIEFDHENTGNEGFMIFGNGVVYGIFDYGHPFYTIGPFSGNGAIYEFVIKDLQFPDCKAFAHIGPIYCNGQCHLYDLHAEVSACNDDGKYSVTLDFEYANAGDEGFKVFGNGNVYGYFSYDDLPVTIGLFNCCGDELEFGVSDVSHPGCHDFVVVEPPCGNADCEIGGLEVDVHPCLSDGTFYVSLDFNHANTGSIFRVKGNGIIYGYFHYDDLPVSVGPLVGNGTTNYEFLVQDVNHPDCSASASIGTVECIASGDCEITDFVADPSSCNDDDSYDLWLNFEVDNPANNYFEVFYEGQLVDFFPLVNLPIILPHFQDNGEPVQHITVCINDHPNCCATFEYEAPDCNGANLVWPGDANADNIANHFDLLSIGLAFNAEGPHRATQGVEWTGLSAENWSQLFAANLNYKHADCNGNGKVTAGDVEAIIVNYNETHSGSPAPVLIDGNENDPAIFVDLPNLLNDGGAFTAPIILGTSDKQVENAYGIAFSLHFDPEIVSPSSIQLKYDPSWIGVEGINLLTLDKTFADAGIIHIALARTDGNNVSGFGQIAALIGIIDNIAGKDNLSMEITDVRAIRGNEALIPLHRPVEVVEILSTGVGETAEPVVAVYPNPATETVTFLTKNAASINTVEIQDINGTLLKVVNLERNSLDISQLPCGVYTLKCQLDGAVAVVKMVKM
jgi:hypothetical protein